VSTRSFELGASALRALNYVPFSGGFCTFSFFDSWKYGCSTVIATKAVHEPGAAEEWVDLMITYGVERALLFGTGLAGAVRVGKPLPALKFIVVSGVPVSEPLVLQGMDLAPNATWINDYGMTEIASVCTNLIYQPGQPLDRANMGSIGRANAYCEVRIDGPLKEVDGHQIGEIVVKAAHLMKGYWRNPEATTEAVEDGLWMHTGDMGYMNSNGDLFMVSRKKDVIILPSAMNILPKDIEDALVSHPKVSLAAAVGAPAKVGVGEDIVACVVGKDVTEEDLREYLSTLLAPFQMPKRYCFLDEMPLTRTNKVAKQTLRDMVKADAAATSLAQSPTETATI
jgi:acyl-CoA synthetase (AMP-forming)/AMP-acid ligase II